jgi:hypothetical protein
MSDTTTPTRDEKIEGLRALADFHADPPDVPVPSLGQIVLHRPASVVGFLDGLDEVPVTKVRPSDDGTTYVMLDRPFGAVTLPAFCRADLVGEVTEVPSIAVEFQPRRPEQIRAALAQSAEGAENGTAGTVPSASPERGAA